MDNPVIIKGNRSGLVLVLDNTEDYDRILNELDRRLENISCRYGPQKNIGTGLALTIKGRSPDNYEADKIISLFKKHGLLISDIIDEDDHSAGKESRGADINHAGYGSTDGLFYRGILRNGQVLRARKSVLIIGDVLNGAAVMSGGSITVLGGLYGTAHAGINGKNDAFITALMMKPEKLMIYETVCSNDDMEKDMPGFLCGNPAIAYTEDGNMFMRRI